MVRVLVVGKAGEQIGSTVARRTAVTVSVQRGADPAVADDLLRWQALPETTVTLAAASPGPRNWTGQITIPANGGELRMLVSRRSGCSPTACRAGRKPSPPASFAGPPPCRYDAARMTTAAAGPVPAVGIAVENDGPLLGLTYRTQ